MREPGVAQDQRGHVHGQEPAGTGQRGRPVAGHDQGQDRDRVQARGRQRHPPQGQRPELAGQQPDRGSRGQLVDHLAGQQRGRGQVMADVAEQGHREDGRRVVEPRLPHQHAGQPGRQRQLAQHREHRGGIGRRQHRTQQQRIPPAQAQQPARRDRDDQDTHHHPGGGQGQRGRSRGAGVRPAGGQPALGQDQHQRAEPQHLGQPGVVEPDADAGLTQGQAQTRPRNTSRPGSPIPCATRADTIAASTTAAPASRIRPRLLVVTASPRVRPHAGHLLVAFQSA